MGKKIFTKRAQSWVDSGFARVLTVLALLLMMATGAWATDSTIEGDLNGDGVVDVADISALISAMNSGYSAAADLDGDGNVTAFDISTLLSIMTGRTPAASTGTKVALTAEDLTIENGEEKELVINMDYETTETPIGLVFSLYLPEGILLRGFNTQEAQAAARPFELKRVCALGENGVWGDDASSGWLGVRPMSDGGLFFILMDQDNKTAFQSTKAVTVVIKIHAIADVSATGTIKGISITDANSMSLDVNGIADVSFEFNKSGSTGLRTTKAIDENGEMFNLNGQRLNSKPAQKGIYIKNGKKAVIE